MVAFNYIDSCKESFKTQEFNAEDSGLQVALGFIEEFLDLNEAPMKVSTQVMIAAEELVVNVVRYAYPEGNGLFSISLNITGNKLTMYLADRGIPFNPTELKEPDTSLSAEERAIGGLGILMVKKTMTSFEYELRDGQNIVKITKEW